MTSIVNETNDNSWQDKPYDTWYRSEKRKTFRAVGKTIFLWMSLYLKMVKKRKICTVFYAR